jgi:hypothetical protein
LTSKPVPGLAGTGSAAGEGKEEPVGDLSDDSGGGGVRRRSNWLRSRSADSEVTLERTSTRMVVVIALGVVVNELLMDAGARSGVGEVVAEQRVDSLNDRAGDARGHVNGSSGDGAFVI